MKIVIELINGDVIVTPPLCGLYFKEDNTANTWHNGKAILIHKNDIKSITIEKA